MVSVLLFLVFGFLFSAEPAADPRVRFRFPVMGTEAVVILFAPQEQAEKAHQGVKEAFDRVLQVANPYDPESEISRLNRTASTAPFVCSEDLWTMLQAAREAWKISGGAFDVTARPIMDLWGFYRIAPDRHAPDEKERKEVLAKVGLDKVRFDDTEHSVFFTVPGMALDLGGLAKGYAVDLALEAIRREGITRGSVNLSGREPGTSGAASDANGLDHRTVCSGPHGRGSYLSDEKHGRLHLRRLRTVHPRRWREDRAHRRSPHRTARSPGVRRLGHCSQCSPGGHPQHGLLSGSKVLPVSDAKQPAPEMESPHPAPTQDRDHSTPDSGKVKEVSQKTPENIGKRLQNLGYGPSGR